MNTTLPASRRRLAASIVDFFLADEALTRESLTLLTGTLRSQLAEILAAARQARSVDAWRTDVVGPLRITVGDLVLGIERRQRGLDSQQEKIQAEIARLLSEEWFQAIDRCQDLLDATTATLRELAEVLLRDTHHFLALLQEIQGLASSADQPLAEEAVQRVIEQVDRIAAWGTARQRAWSDYYQFVHRYLRDVVRLDPDRALSQRLRDQLSGWTNAPFHLVTTASSPVVMLRPVEHRVVRPPVARPRAEREVALELVAPEDAMADLEARVRAALRSSTSLVEVTARVLDGLPEATRYGAAGRVAACVARLARVRSDRERPWVPATAALEIEDWAVAPEGRQ